MSEVTIPSQKSSARAQGHRVLNVRLLVASLATTLLFALVLYFVRNYQLARSAEAFLARADALEQKERWGEAVGYLQRYAALRPDERSVHVRIAEDFDRSARDGRGANTAISLLYRAIGVEPKNDELRQRLLDRLMQERKWSAAKEQLAVLAELPGKDNHQAAIRAAAVIALEEVGAGDRVALRKARKQLEDAHQKFPGDVIIATAFANLLRQNYDALGLDSAAAAKTADAAMDAMIVAGPIEQSRFQRYLYRERFGLTGAADDLEAAIQAAPKNVIVLLAAGDYFLAPKAATQNLKRSREYFAQAVNLAPRLAPTHLGLGRALRAAGDDAGAEKAWTDGARMVVGDNRSLLLELFQFYAAKRNIAAAETTFATLAKTLNGDASEHRPEDRRLLLRLQAQLAISKGDINSAAKLLNSSLEQTQGMSPSTGADQASDRRLLAQAYSQMESWDLAAAELDQVASQTPQLPQPHIAAANAWRRSGRLDRAIASQARATACQSAEPHAWIQLAELQLQQQLAMPPSARKWDDFRRTLENVKQKARGEWELALIEADYLAAEDSPTSKRSAVALLKAAEREHAKTIEFWQRLPLAYERLGEPAAADRSLLQLESVGSDKVAAALVAADLLTLRMKYEAAQTKLVNVLPHADGAQAGAIQDRRVRIYLAAGKNDLARRTLDDFIRSRPTDVNLLKQAIDLAVADKDWISAERYESQLQKTEGEAGVNWKLYRARRLLLANRPNAAALAEVHRLLATIQSQKPRWAAVSLLAGFAAQIEDNPNEAIALYMRAIEQGERGADTYERLVTLLLSANRLADAHGMLERMAQNGIGSTGVEVLSIELYARQNQADRALTIAKQAVARSPKDAIRHVWLANMLALQKQNQQALAEFNEAVRLAPQDLRVLGALFTFHRLQGREDDAEKVLLAMSKLSDVSAAQSANILGQGYALLGKTAQAEKLLTEAARLTPNDVPTLMRLAALQVDSDKAAARLTLEKILAIDPQAHVARRTLATVLADSQGGDGWDAAVALLTKGGNAEQTPVDNDRLRALMLARRRAEKEAQLQSLAEALRIMEKRTELEHRIDPIDRSILAEIFERQGRLTMDVARYLAARDQLRALVERPSPAASDLRSYVGFLLRMAASEAVTNGKQNGRKLADELLADAERQLADIEPIERETKAYPSAETLKLKVALWKAQSRQSAAVPMLDKIATQGLAVLTDKSRRSAWMLTVGQAYESLEKPAAAENWLRKARAEQPASYVALAEFLARRNRLDEAISICESAFKSDPSPATALVMANLAVANRPTPEILKRIEPQLALCLDRDPQNIGLLFSTGLIRTLRGQSEQAIVCFEKLIEIDPRHVLALNNLATLLAERDGRRGDALKYVDRAIQVGGRQPMLLDTQGTIHLLNGNSSEAIKSLDEAVRFGGSDARYWFHLAAAYQHQGDAKQAKAAFERARQLGFERQVLTADDVRFKRDLEKLL